MLPRPLLLFHAVLLACLLPHASAGQTIQVLELITVTDVARASGAPMIQVTEMILVTEDQGGQLPVELTHFEAVLDGLDVVLRWETASETNNAGFGVEVQEEGSNTEEGGWESVYFVDGYGTTIEPQAYQYRIADLSPGRHHFRLKQVDFDGTFAYSPEVEVLVGVLDGFALSEVYPNPFRTEAHVSLAVGQPQHVTLALYDMLGRRVTVLLDEKMESNHARLFTIRADELASGIYFLQATGTTFNITKRLVLLK